MADDDAERRRDAERLRALEAKLGARRGPGPSTSGALGRSVDQANYAWRMVTELVAGLVLGFGIGLGLDWLLGTRPLMLVIFTLAGFAAGVKTMLRTARDMGAPAAEDAAPAGEAGPADARDDDDETDDDTRQERGA